MVLTSKKFKFDTNNSKIPTELHSDEIPKKEKNYPEIIPTKNLSRE